MPRAWVWAPTNIPPKCKLSKWQKEGLRAEADRFVAEFYRAGIKAPPKKPQSNYIVGYSTKWHGSYLQFIAHYLCPGPNALSPSFEIAFARLGYFTSDSWNIWARRHNDEWMVLGRRMTLKECFREMRSNPWFHH